MVEATTATKRVIVTGGNAGIGYALCKLLVIEHGCYVYMGCRNATKGKAAIEALAKEDARCKDKIELVEVDVSKPASITAAAETVKGKLGNEKLYALVNNAGTGLAHKGVTADDIINTNVYGVVNMSVAFVPLIEPAGGRIVNLGSGAGTMFTAKQDQEKQAFLSTESPTW